MEVLELCATSMCSSSGKPKNFLSCQRSFIFGIQVFFCGLKEETHCQLTASSSLRPEAFWNGGLGSSECKSPGIGANDLDCSAHSEAVWLESEVETREHEMLYSLMILF